MITLLGCPGPAVAAVSYEITDLLSARISLDFDYETHPADLAENEDLVLLFGFGAEF
ncbi:MAG: hypothetical protein IIA40_09215 [SAR324 cluster bacterium]|nr:hypothetical protein [SAR324 cluster bacterium]